MISDGETGFLVKPGNISDISKKIIRLISDKKLSDSFGNAFYNRAKENFSDVKMAQTHKNIYDKIVKEKER